MLNQQNNSKKLLNMFWASWYIQENIMYQNRNYKKEYPVILKEIQSMYKDIDNSIEARIFHLCDNWSNDLFGILDDIITQEYGILNKETKQLYFNQNVKEYVDKYIQTL